MMEKTPLSEYDLPVLASSDSNFMPDEKVTMSLRATIEHQQHEMERIDANIAYLETRLSELRAQRTLVQRSWEVNKALVAPVRKLPPETLGEVFIHCLPASSYMGRYSGISYYEAPLLLMRVCRKWQRIAIGTPRLWTKLCLGSKFKLNASRVIRIWLLNSGTLPIDINMQPTEWPEADKAEVPEATRLIIENFHRFRCFDGDFDSYLGHEIEQRLETIHAPLLEDFRLSWSLVEGYIPLPLSEGRIRAPKLACLSLEDPSMRKLISFHPPSVHRLRLWGDGSPDAITSLDFLPSYTNLSFLSIDLYEGLQPPTVRGRSRIPFPSLEALGVNFMFPHDPCPFLNTFEVPALRALTLTFEKAGTEEIALPLLAAVDSLLSGDPSLQRLFLHGFDPIDPTAFISLLLRLRKLLSLALQNCHIDDSILKALTLDVSPPDGPRTCPHLSNLCVTGATFSQDLFVELVRSRAPPNLDVTGSGVGYLQCVDVGDTYLEDEEFIALLLDISQRSGGLLEVRCEKTWLEVGATANSA